MAHYLLYKNLGVSLNFYAFESPHHECTVFLA